MARHWLCAGSYLVAALGLFLLALPNAAVGARTLADATTLALTGKVCARDTGKPIAGAQVGIAGRTAVADTSGAYALTVPAAVHLYAQASAQGYQSTGIVSVTGPSGTLLSGRATLSFCGDAALLYAFSSEDHSLQLMPFAQLLPAGAAALQVTGTSTVRLESDAAIETPGGQVVLAPIQHQGKHIEFTVPLNGGNGRYVLEINGQPGFALIEVPLFAGAAYSAPPAPPIFMSDPEGATLSALQDMAVQQFNWIRAHAGLPLLQQDARLCREAQAHSADIVSGGYLDRHAHIGSNGSTPGDRVAASGVTYQEAAEVVGTGLTVQQIVIGLMDSPAHRWAILGQFHLIGVGIVHSGSDLVLTGDFVR